MKPDRSSLCKGSLAMLMYIESRAGYIELYRMINVVQRKTFESHSTRWYVTRLYALALEGHIHSKVNRVGDKIGIRYRKLPNTGL